MLAGYCLGGTIALARRLRRAPVAGLAMIAAPWRFSGFGNTARGDIAELWRAAQPACERMGLVPMEVLQAGFWRLDPARTIAKYEAFAAMEPGSRRSTILRRDGGLGECRCALPYAAGRQMFDDFIEADLPGTGRWRVGGPIVDPAQSDLPGGRLRVDDRPDRAGPQRSRPARPARSGRGACRHDRRGAAGVRNYGNRWRTG